MNLLKDSDVAALVKLSRRQIWKLLAMGRLPEPIRLGRSVRWRATDIDKWIQGGCGRVESVVTTGEARR